MNLSSRTGSGEEEESAGKIMESGKGEGEGVDGGYVKGRGASR